MKANVIETINRLAKIVWERTPESEKKESKCAPTRYVSIGIHGGYEYYIHENHYNQDGVKITDVILAHPYSESLAKLSLNTLWVFVNILLGELEKKLERNLNICESCRRNIICRLDSEVMKDCRYYQKKV